MKFYYTLFLGLILLVSCMDSKKQDIVSQAEEYPTYANYSSVKFLQDTISKLTLSNEEIFLSFRIGMSKVEFKKHVSDLKKQGVKIHYSSSNEVMTIAGTFNIGMGYRFETDLSYNLKGEAYNGSATYLLIPEFNEQSLLIKLTILCDEDYTNCYTCEKDTWIKSQIINNSNSFNDKNLIQKMLKLDLVNNNSLIRMKNNVVIYSSSNYIYYIDKKTFFEEILKKIQKTDKTNSENKNIKF